MPGRRLLQLSNSNANLRPTDRRRSASPAASRTSARTSNSTINQPTVDGIGSNPPIYVTAGPHNNGTFPTRPGQNAGQTQRRSVSPGNREHAGASFLPRVPMNSPIGAGQTAHVPPASYGSDDENFRVRFPAQHMPPQTGELRVFLSWGDDRRANALLQGNNTEPRRERRTEVVMDPPALLDARRPPALSVLYVQGETSTQLFRRQCLLWHFVYGSNNQREERPDWRFYPSSRILRHTLEPSQWHRDILVNPNTSWVSPVLDVEFGYNNDSALIPVAYLEHETYLQVMTRMRLALEVMANLRTTDDIEAEWQTFVRRRT